MGQNGHWNLSDFGVKDNKFSNFYPCRVEVFGREFSSSEVAYQWRKAVFLGEAGVAADIGRVRVAREAKWAADRAFGKRGWYPVTVGRRARMSQWEDAKVEVMRQILRAKARGCAEFVAELRRSGERPLHEAVPKEEFWGIGQGSGRNWLGVLLMDLRTILDDVLHSNNRDDGIDLRPESGGPVRPMRAREEVENTIEDRKRASTSGASGGEKRQRGDREGYARVEEETPVGKGIFFGSSQLRELADKSGKGLAATALAEKWEIKMWRGGEIEHVHKMVDETEWEKLDGAVKWAVVTVGGNDVDHTERVWVEQGWKVTEGGRLDRIIKEKLELWGELMSKNKITYRPGGGVATWN